MLWACTRTNDMTESAPCFKLLAKTETVQTELSVLSILSASIGEERILSLNLFCGKKVSNNKSEKCGKIKPKSPWNWILAEDSHKVCLRKPWQIQKKIAKGKCRAIWRVFGSKEYSSQKFYNVTKLATRALKVDYLSALSTLRGWPKPRTLSYSPDCIFVHLWPSGL